MRDRITILLLVEDDEASRDLIGRQLAHQGYVVMTASNGREGVELAHGESPDLILMDLSMPGMDGFEATKQLKSHRKTAHIPIVAVSALSSAVEVRRAAQAGCNGYEAKPVDPNRLNLKIRSLVPRE